MNADEALEIVESQVLSRQLTPIERLIFSQSWEGKGYMEMVEGSGYNSNYFKEVGSRLWHSLSEILGQKVRKKNLQIVFRDYQPNSTTKSNQIESLQLFKQIAVENSFSEPSICNNTLEASSPLQNKAPLDYINNDIKFPNGPVPLNSPLYIKRPPQLKNLHSKKFINQDALFVLKLPRKWVKVLCSIGLLLIQKLVITRLSI